MVQVMLTGMNSTACRISFSNMAHIVVVFLFCSCCYDGGGFVVTIIVMMILYCRINEGEAMYYNSSGGRQEQI